LANVHYTGQEKYHVRIETDTANATYDVFVTDPSGNEVQIAKDYKYRYVTTASTVDVGKVTFISEKGAALFKVENHKVGPYKAPIKYASLSSGKSYSSKPDMSATYKLGSKKGKIQIDFDVTPMSTKIDGIIGYTGTAIVPDWPNLCLIIQLDKNGYFEARNGSSYSKKANVTYSAGKKYHVRITTDISKRKYSVYVTVGKKVVQIAKDFAYRSDSPKGTDIGKVSFISEQGAGLFKVQNHKIKAIK
jgi:hypothetical protein